MELLAVLAQNQFTLTAKRISCLSVQSGRDEALYLSVCMCVFADTNTHTSAMEGRQLLTCDVDAVGALTPHCPAVVAPCARPPLVTVALPPCGDDNTRHSAMTL